MTYTFALKKATIIDGYSVIHAIFCLQIYIGDHTDTQYSFDIFHDRSLVLMCQH